ncbi:hypothetical protein MA16_Dca000472 [Dendrobium catenatum]|uniref:Uncharacterized protein n=1 Tax=Dendrobium catenatum TaxID=906689 RepID=A0A2I0WTZ2_9ASPA|nr:hypothetical protein MA16_Dca000472 [Dendrobium catenatum]
MRILTINNVNTNSQSVQLNLFYSIQRTTQRSEAGKTTAKRIKHEHGPKLEGSIQEFEQIFINGNEK